MPKKIIIAIDGWSSCGKSTLARELADALHYHYVDSGAIYRAITLHLLRNRVELSAHAAVAADLQDVEVHFERNPDTGVSDMHLNGENVAREIREAAVADRVSEVAAIREVRHFAVAQQKVMGRRRGLVMDGRDIGTVVFPDAELKIFMTADPDVRVLRRYDELFHSGKPLSMEDVKANLEMRDYIDSNREESPLRQAPDARVLDNSHLSREEQLRTVLEWVEEVLSGVAEQQ